MPVNFITDTDGPYFISPYEGIVSEDELLDGWMNFLESEDWIPGTYHLADLSGADLSDITTASVRMVASIIDEAYREKSLSQVKLALYSPNPGPYGLAIIYEIFASDAYQTIRLFRYLTEAVSWLEE